MLVVYKKGLAVTQRLMISPETSIRVYIYIYIYIYICVCVCVCVYVCLRVSVCEIKYNIQMLS